MIHRRRLLGVELALIVSLALPWTASAAVVWTLTGSPLTAQAGVSTTFTLTATNENLLSVIGCVRVDATTHFAVESAAIAIGRPWTTSVNGSTVTARSLTSAGTLGFLQSLVVTVKATPKDAGTWSWTGRAYADINCGGGALLGVPLVVIVVTAAKPTPTPTPTPKPTDTPAPTARPTETPPPLLPTPTLPISLPSLLPVPTRAPDTSPTPGPSPSAAASDEPASARPSGSPSTGAGGTSSSPPGAAGGSGAGPALRRDTFDISSGDVRIDAGLDGTDVGLSAVLTIAAPTLLLSVPGLLIILAFAAQLAGGLFWIPVVRRHLGERRRIPRTRYVRRAEPR